MNRMILTFDVRDVDEGELQAAFLSAYNELSKFGPVVGSIMPKNY